MIRPRDYWPVNALPALLAVACVAYGPTAFAAERAVVIGISDYVTDKSPSGIVRERRIKNLPAAEKDSALFTELLIQRFEFDRDNIHRLTNQEATREAILGSIEHVLVKESEPGDIAVLYFAGHGSQVENDASTELDRLDETLLPADAVSGVPDIRDKELRRLLNKVIDRGAELIVVIDACHSGSVTRGFALPSQVTRGVKPARQSWAPFDPGPLPSTRGALVLTSAADSQLARDGAFTSVLRDALLAGERNEPAQDTFRRLRATMQSQGLPQEPGLAATSERRLRPFIPAANSETPATMSFAVTHLDAASNRVLIQGGEAIGLQPGTTLVPKNGSDSVVLNVKGHLDLTRTAVTFRKGGIDDIAIGDLMVVRSVAASPSSQVSVWIERAEGIRAQDLATLHELRERMDDRWVDDPTAKTPDWVLSRADSHWLLRCMTEEPVSHRWQSLASDELLAKVGATDSLFVALPVDTNQRNALIERLTSGRIPVVLADSAADAHYALAGRLGQTGPEFAWIAPNAVESSWNSPLPLRTDWVSGDDVDTLADYLGRISRIKGWLSLRSPIEARPFAYDLIFETQASREKRQGGSQRVGDVYDVKLRLRNDDDSFTLARRFVYLLALDSYGASHLLWPQDCESASTEQLPGKAVRSRAPTEIQLLSGLRVQPPAGVDTIVMLTSETPVDDPCSIEAAGVRTRLPGADPLSLVLGQVGQRTRRPALVPRDWTIDHFVFKTEEQ
ncbi:MAG: caspase family protein [Pseudomonadota bacterium]